MENKLDIRVGDVVRLRPMKVDYVSGEVVNLRSSSLKFCKTETVWIESVESIISRAETDAEKIARLEAELAKAPRRIEWSGGECPLGGAEMVTVWLSNGFVTTSRANDFAWESADFRAHVIAYMVLPQ